MKATGIVRGLDQLGRLVIPMELRRNLRFEDNQRVDIHVDGERIVLIKYNDNCFVCGGVEGIISYGHRFVCTECVEQLVKIANAN